MCSPDELVLARRARPRRRRRRSTRRAARSSRNPMMVTGLARIGEAFRQVSEHGKQRALGHAASGPCLQQNLVCVVEASVSSRDGRTVLRSSGSGRRSWRRCATTCRSPGIVPRSGDPRARRRGDDVEGRRGRRHRHRARHLRRRDDARAVPRRRARRRGQADHARAHRGQRRRIDRGRRDAPHRVAACTSACSRVAFEKQSEGDTNFAFSTGRSGGVGAGGYFAPHIRAYIERSGAPDYVGPMVAVKDRQNALKNPYAHLQIPDISIEMVLESPFVWAPIHRLESCPTSDGACAMVLTDEAGGKRASKPPAWVHGTAVRTELGWFPGRDPVNPQGGQDCAADVYKQAGCHRTRARTSTWSRSTCRSAGTSRCGWRTSASRRVARAGR